MGITLSKEQLIKLTKEDLVNIIIDSYQTRDRIVLIKESQDEYKLGDYPPYTITYSS